MTRHLRTFAFYLPQFHPIAENDEWWGTGFTEWTNVTRATPQYPGHVQPVLPTETGFYDLRVPEVRAAQAELAKAHGIDGFIYYHYWFGGRQVLERPLDEVLRSGEPGLPFAVCWANEDWRRNWDGRTGEVLIGQQYSDEDDVAHIRWMIDLFRDERYIRVEGKPLVMVYRASLLPDPARTAAIWRDEARAAGIGELHLCCVEAMERADDPEAIGFDAAVEFAPDWENLGPAAMHGEVETHDYLEMAARMHAKATPIYRRYPCVTPGFDNTPRRGAKAFVLDGATPDLYKGWVAATVAKEIKVAESHGDEPILFVNSWNEWAEGAMLEPSSRWGRGFLEAHAAGIEQGVQLASQQELTSSQPAASEAVVADGPQPVLSVALLTNGDPASLVRALQSALTAFGALGNLQFIVVDNGTADGTAEALEQLRGSVTVVRNDVPVAPEQAWRQAIAQCTADYVLCVSTDVVLSEPCALPLCQSIIADPSVPAVTPSIVVGGATVPSQPLSSATGVCLLVRSETARTSLPTEAHHVKDAFVRQEPLAGMVGS